MDVTRLEALFAERRYRRLADALGSAEPDEDLAIARLRSQLVTRGLAPLVDAVEAARRLADDGADDAPLYAARAVRALAAAGATRSARAQLDSAWQRWPEHEELALVRDQLEADELEAEDRAEHLGRLALRAGDTAAARAHLEHELAERSVTGRERAHRLLADLTRAERDFAAAAETFARAAADAPDASDAPMLEASAALCRWAAGDVEAATDALRRLQDETRGQREQVHAYLRAQEVLDRLDRDPEARDAGPRWCFGPPLETLRRPGDAGAGALAVCLRRFEVGAEPAQAQSMAMLRHHLSAAGLRSLRLVATPERVEAAVRAGALAVVQQERATHTAFPIVLGVEPVAGLLLLHEPTRGGAFLQTLEEHQDQSRMFGDGAMVVLGAGDAADALEASLAEAGVAHDARFDAIDACDVDADGRVPTRARMDALASRAIDEAPELPTPHRRQGEVMLERLRDGTLAAGRMERWVAVTREKFGRTEWALQIYAQAMEVWRRPQTAAIAWADAAALDPFDHRNPWGEARNLLAFGETKLAEERIRETLSLRHGHAPAMARWATLLLDRGRVERARALSELAEELAPEDRGVLGARATVLERAERYDEALERLNRVADAHPQDTGVRARILKRLFHAGRWEDGVALAETLPRIDPGDPLNWDDLAFAWFGAGDVERSMDVVLDALSRCGAHRSLVSMAGRGLATGFAADRMEARAAQLEQALGPAPLHLMDVAVELVRRRHDELGVRLALAARARMPHDVNGPWRAAQTLLAIPHHRGGEQVGALLDETIERAGPYPHPRVVAALYGLDTDPEASVALLEAADVGAGPALVFGALSRAYAATGNDEAAAQTRGRLRELSADHLARAAGFLGTVGLSTHALELLAVGLDDDGLPPPARKRLREEAARQHLRLGQATEANAMLDGLDDVDPDTGVRAATLAADWDVAARRAELEVQSATRRSLGGYDAWVMRAWHAGARLALGDPAPAASLRERAGTHADALAALVEIERLASIADAEADLSRLASAAPGATQTIERGGRRW